MLNIFSIHLVPSDNEVKSSNFAKWKECSNYFRLHFAIALEI